jgi:hypothetical protein
LIPNPIRKVLSTLSSHEVRHLLMGGQACVFYGAAEFSRDCDIAILCDAPNLRRLNETLTELAAERIAVPPMAAEYLERGHAVHFRCRASEVVGMRVDVMSKMRGVAEFDVLWERRVTLQDDEGCRIELMSLPDLVTAKKTQRDKDWPMIRRLVESHYSQHRAAPNQEQVMFWLMESRTAEQLIDVAAADPEAAAIAAVKRTLIEYAGSADREQLDRGLADEERREREADRLYWLPLRAELEELRRQRS